MERLRYADGAYPPPCFTCPARTYIGGEYYCNPDTLNDPSIILEVARYRPDRCPNRPRSDGGQASPTVLLRRVLGK
ncbi:MAG: hypothetical protein UU51_C0005G0002 [Microgenomates group bacterium GW2011_GWC1_41_20]|uniref:Uncharacterized protein n=2 Tax=Candidatus Woeseibacteriota TaxID=1752722 RepID=A0A0G0QQA6_9BACT|nr:MAG: hypothetical protein UT76_C0023G0003 [Candidatus Woesebacteria bacterium GW2011_GWB1_40_12]KKS00557.1 MAG: hypothetical protein UU51_C0005G0002 [Microgenomates group bacterium GW2011_GWC1_41_20]KKS05413.1 MAG: hypothetical protein UU57_C0007G0003 [Candidatus Woesebacteria bacterium GW2011_GWE1_41_24]